MSIEAPIIHASEVAHGYGVGWVVTKLCTGERLKNDVAKADCVLINVFENRLKVTCPKCIEKMESEEFFK